jgi:pyrroline-5-carboxylate reductase
MERTLAVIGVGNMAKSIIAGITSSTLSVSKFYLFDKNEETYKSLENNNSFEYCKGIYDAVNSADCVLLSVKPQNYSEIREEIKCVPNFNKKLYISIAAGITSESVSNTLSGATVIRVLPNLPMTIGKGVSAICKNDTANTDDFAFVDAVFASAGSTIIIDESEMNRYISVTSSSPAYVFLLIRAICDGAAAQGLDAPDVLGAVCDMVAGSARLLAESGKTPDEMIRMVASKGGTTERALAVFAEEDFADTVARAMQACTDRADELGKKPSA